MNKKFGFINISSLFVVTILTACGGGGGGDSGGTSSPEIISSIDLPDSGRGVTVAGNYAYVAASGSGLQVIDVGDKSAPFIEAEESTGRGSGGVQYVDRGSERFILMAGGTQGVHAINVTTPTAPAFDSTAITPGNNTDISISTDLLTICAVDGSAGVIVYDVFIPFDIKQVATPESTYGAAISGDYCFVTGGTSLGGGAPALYVINISSTAGASIAHTLPLDGTPSGIAIIGDYAYVPAGDPGMFVIDISTPTSPVVAGQTGFLSATGDIAVDATRMRAYLGTTDTAGFPNDGLKVIDISNPGSPAVIATTDLPNWTFGVEAVDGFVYATTYDPGGPGVSQFHIVDVSTF